MKLYPIPKKCYACYGIGFLSIVKQIPCSHRFRNNFEYNSKCPTCLNKNYVNEISQTSCIVCNGFGKLYYKQIKLLTTN